MIIKSTHGKSLHGGHQAGTTFEANSGHLIEVVTMKRYGGNLRTTVSHGIRINQYMIESEWDATFKTFDHGRERATKTTVLRAHAIVTGEVRNDIESGKIRIRSEVTA